MLFAAGPEEAQSAWFIQCHTHIYTQTFTTLKPQKSPALIWWSVCTEARWRGWMGIQSPSARWRLTDSGCLSSIRRSLNSASIYPMLLSDTHRLSHIPTHTHSTNATHNGRSSVCLLRKYFLIYAACSRTSHVPKAPRWLTADVPNLWPSLTKHSLHSNWRSKRPHSQKLK